MISNFDCMPVDDSESTNENELAEYQELVYELGYSPRPNEE